MKFKGGDNNDSDLMQFSESYNPFDDYENGIFKTKSTTQINHVNPNQVQFKPNGAYDDKNNVFGEPAQAQAQTQNSFFPVAPAPTPTQNPLFPVAQAQLTLPVVQQVQKTPTLPVEELEKIKTDKEARDIIKDFNFTNYIQCQSDLWKLFRKIRKSRSGTKTCNSNNMNRMEKEAMELFYLDITNAQDEVNYVVSYDHIINNEVKVCFPKKFRFNYEFKGDTTDRLFKKSRPKQNDEYMKTKNSTMNPLRNEKHVLLTVPRINIFAATAPTITHKWFGRGNYKNKTKCRNKRTKCKNKKTKCKNKRTKCKNNYKRRGTRRRKK